MPLEGLRAWIGEVERKLGMRTRVFLVLTVIALGGAGAAIYLAIDARESSVSESDVQALQERLEAQIGEGGTSVPAVPEEPEEPAPEPEPSPGQGDRSGGTGGTGGASAEGNNSAGGSAAEGGTDTGGSSKAKLKGLIEEAKAENARAEAEQAGK